MTRPNTEIKVRRLDLSDLSSVREFTEVWSGGIDALVNNTGVAIVPPASTADGFELQFGANHIGHIALANLLFVLELQRRAQQGSTARALAAPPGHAASNLGTQDRSRFLAGTARFARAGLAGQRAEAAVADDLGSRSSVLGDRTAGDLAHADHSDAGPATNAGYGPA